MTSINPIEFHSSGNTSSQTIKPLNFFGDRAEVTWQLNIRTWASKTLASFFRAILHV
jgi:hypothetical protein